MQKLNWKSLSKAPLLPGGDAELWGWQKDPLGSVLTQAGMVLNKMALLPAPKLPLVFLILGANPSS